MQELWQELMPLFANVQSALRAIGEALLAKRPRIGLGGIGSTIQRCHAHWGVSQAMLWVWYRVAAGEIPENLTRTAIHYNTLQHMPSDVAEALAKDPSVRVASHALERAVNKRVSQMTREECRAQIRPQGFVPIEEADSGPGPYRFFKATAVNVDEGKKRVLLTVANAHIVVFASATALQKAIDKLAVKS
jgi:hypothetical protein